MKYIDEIIQTKVQAFRQKLEDFLKHTELEDEDLEMEVSILSDDFARLESLTPGIALRIAQESPEALEKQFYIADEIYSVLDVLHLWCIERIWDAFVEQLFKPNGLDVARPWEEA